MDRAALRRLLDELDDAAAHAQGALWVVGPGRRPEEMRAAAHVARRRLEELRARLASAGAEVEAMHRRDLLRALPVLAVTPASVDRLTAAHAVDDALLAAYQEVLDEASRAWQTADLEELYAAVAPITRRIGERLRADMTAGRRARLAGIAAELANLAGWNALVTGRRGLAREHFGLAQQAAREASDGGLEAMAVEGGANLDSVVFFGGWTGSRPALRGHERAAGHLTDATPAVLRQWVLSRLAHEMAAVGDPAFLDVLDEAREVEDGRGAHAPTGLMVVGGFWASGPRLDDVEALGRAMNGDAGESVRLLERQRRLVPAGLPRRGAVVAIGLAQVHAARQEPEQAAALAQEALDVALRTRAALDVLRVRALALRLDVGVPAVAELRDRLAATPPGS
jgi:hypothetical protein